MTTDTTGTLDTQQSTDTRYLFNQGANDGMPLTLTAEELEQLTDSERAVLADGDETPVDDPKPKPEAGDKPDDANPEDEDADPSDPEAKPLEGDTPSTDVADEPATPAAVEPPALEQVPDVSKDRQLLDGFIQAKKDLLDKGLDGDLGSEELDTKLDELYAAKADAERSIDAAAQIEAANTDKLNAGWNASVAAKQSEYPALGRAGSIGEAAFDRQLRLVDAAPEHKHLSDDDKVDLALAGTLKILSDQGLQISKADGGTKTPPTKADDKTKKLEVNKNKRDDPPQNLSNMPQTEIPGGTDSKYYALDQMKGEELQKALQKLTPEEHNAYLAAS